MTTGTPDRRSDAPTRGPLTVHPANPRYFADRDGRPIYLTGSHTWANLQELGPTSPPEPFDYPGWLDFMVGHGHNFMRLWMFENARWNTWAAPDYYFEPLPWLRTGPGTALDGRPRFDLERFDPAWFDRLRTRVEQARARGIYTAVMLFQGWSGEWKGWSPATGPKGRDPWHGHPFNAANNVNGVDGASPGVDPLGGEGKGGVHTLRDPAVTRLQRAYLRRVVETVGDLDNVLYEIGNEHAATAANTAWQYAMIEALHDLERDAALPQRHPVLMTAQWPAGRNDVLFAGPADAVSPAPWNRAGDADWKHDPPAAGGAKVVLVDTDHLWGVGGGVGWVWKTFTRGHNPIYMDPWGYGHLDPKPPRDDVRRAMGATRRLARDIDLARMVPHPELAATGFVLADPGRDYVVFQPHDDSLRIDLTAAVGSFVARWLHPVTLDQAATRELTGGAVIDLAPPGAGSWVLRLSAAAAGTDPT